MNCSQCGQAVPAGKKFCPQCGAPTGAASSAPRPQKPDAKAEGSARGLSIWWIIIPTLIYAWIDRNPVKVVGLVGFGALLKFAQGRPEIPARARAFLPLLQSAAAFIMVGGNAIVVAVTAGFGFLVVRYQETLVSALEPWWRIQQALPTVVRYVVGFVLTLGIGYVFGSLAEGAEWSVTLISITVATVVMFLFTFNPPLELGRNPASRTGR